MFFKRKSFHPYVIFSNYQLLVNFLCIAPLMMCIYIQSVKIFDTFRKNDYKTNAVHQGVCNHENINKSINKIEKIKENGGKKRGNFRVLLK